MAPKMSLSGAALVKMMESADFRDRNNPQHGCRWIGRGSGVSFPNPRCFRL